MALKSNSLTVRQASSPAHLSPLQIATLAASKGVRNEARLRIAVAVALAESGGNPHSHSPTEDYGLYNINRPTWDKATHRPGAFVDWSRINDPAYNTEVMAKISKNGTDFSAWSTYKNGSYQQFMGVLSPAQVKAAISITPGGNTGGGWIPGVPDPGDIHINPIKWVDEAAHAVVDFLKIMVDPVKLGEHAANALLWLLKKFVKGVYVVIILPPWRWTQRATLYYWEANIIQDEKVGGQRYAISVKAIATMGFWAVGYAILWGKFDPMEARVPADESAFASTIAAGRNAVVARRITKPKDVEKKTAVKPQATKTTVPVNVVRTVAATRRRTVKVHGTGEQHPTENSTETQQQQAQDTASEATE